MRVEFLFDFGSPNAYLSHAVIPAIEKRTGATFTYVPVLLGGLFKLTNNRSPVEAFAGVENKVAFGRVEMERFIRRHAIPFRMNPYFPVNTLNLMRLAVAADSEGVLMPYVEAAFRHMWVEPKKMDDPAVAREALAASGAPIDRLIELAGTPAVKERLLKNTQEAADRGAFGSPTFFVGKEMFFGKDQLRDVEDAVSAGKVV